MVVPPETYDTPPNCEQKKGRGRNKRGIEKKKGTGKEEKKEEGR